MTICPKCKAINARLMKEWKFGFYLVQMCLCKKCHTTFREYTKDGKHSFTLIYIPEQELGKNWQKIS